MHPLTFVMAFCGVLTTLHAYDCEENRVVMTLASTFLFAPLCRFIIHDIISPFCDLITQREDLLARWLRALGVWCGVMLLLWLLWLWWKKACDTVEHATQPQEISDDQPPSCPGSFPGDKTPIDTAQASPATPKDGQRSATPQKAGDITPPPATLDISPPSYQVNPSEDDTPTAPPPTPQCTTRSTLLRKADDTTRPNATTRNVPTSSQKSSISSHAPSAPSIATNPLPRSAYGRQSVPHREAGNIMPPIVAPYDLTPSRSMGFCKHEASKAQPLAAYPPNGRQSAPLRKAGDTTPPTVATFDLPPSGPSGFRKHEASKAQPPARYPPNARRSERLRMARNTTQLKAVPFSLPPSRLKRLSRRNPPKALPSATNALNGQRSAPLLKASDTTPPEAVLVDSPPSCLEGRSGYDALKAPPPAIDSLNGQRSVALPKAGDNTPPRAAADTSAPFESHSVPQGQSTATASPPAFSNGLPSALPGKNGITTFPEARTMQRRVLPYDTEEDDDEDAIEVTQEEGSDSVHRTGMQDCNCTAVSDLIENFEELSIGPLRTLAYVSDSATPAAFALTASTVFSRNDIGGDDPGIFRPGPIDINMDDAHQAEDSVSTSDVLLSAADEPKQMDDVVVGAVPRISGYIPDSMAPEDDAMMDVAAFGIDDKTGDDRSPTDFHFRGPTAKPDDSRSSGHSFISTTPEDHTMTDSEGFNSDYNTGDHRSTIVFHFAGDTAQPNHSQKSGFSFNFTAPKDHIVPRSTVSNGDAVTGDDHHHVVAAFQSTGATAQLGHPRTPKYSFDFAVAGGSTATDSAVFSSDNAAGDNPAAKAHPSNAHMHVDRSADGRSKRISGDDLQIDNKNGDTKCGDGSASEPNGLEGRKKPRTSDIELSTAAQPERPIAKFKPRPDLMDPTSDNRPLEVMGPVSALPVIGKWVQLSSHKIPSFYQLVCEDLDADEVDGYFAQADVVQEINHIQYRLQQICHYGTNGIGRQWDLKRITQAAVMTIYEVFEEDYVLLKESIAPELQRKNSHFEAVLDAWEDFVALTRQIKATADSNNEKRKQ